MARESKMNQRPITGIRIFRPPAIIFHSWSRPVHTAMALTLYFLALFPSPPSLFFPALTLN